MALFLISGSGRGVGGTAISLATRLHGICNASHNRMEEVTHLEHLSYCPSHSLGTGDNCPPTTCFRVLFGNIHQCSIHRDQTTGDLKSNHLQAGVTALSVPPPFLSAVHDFLRALTASSGGHVPLMPSLGPAMPRMSGASLSMLDPGYDLRTSLRLFVRSWISCTFCFPPLCLV